MVGPPAAKREPIAFEAAGGGEAAVPGDADLRAQVKREIAEKVTAWELVRLPGQDGFFFGTDVVTSDYSLALESYGSFLIPWKEGDGPPSED